MAQVLRPLLPVDDPEALVDATTRDDAAVYQIADDRALVVTLDFFTPIVDDPWDFGRIAAANSLSDIYAMGARPLFALNLLAFPRDLLDEGLVQGIIAGGSEKAKEAGIPIMGGHSIDDPEPKYGMVVVGEAHPDRMLTNDGAQVGDDLVLTKPLGTGIIATAIKADVCPPEVVRRAVDSMATLNKAACEVALELGAHAATDITGFGLLGHLGNMVRASDVSARIDRSQVPIHDGVRDLMEMGQIPGGTRRNLTDVASWVAFSDGVTEQDRLLLADAQTSGGLLLSVDPARTEELVERLTAAGVPAAVVGSITQGEGTIVVV